MIEKHLTPTQYRLRLSEFLTGGTGQTFWDAYARLYDDALTLSHEDDELRELKAEVDQLRSALQDANLDLLEARAERDGLRAKRKPKEEKS